MGVERLSITTEKATYFFPLDRYYYTQDPGHIWFKPIDSIFEVGFDYFGQLQAGTILHVRIRPLGKEFAKGTAFGTVESDKWIGPLRLPLTAVLIESNQEVLETPKLINDDPYGRWVIRIQPTKLEEEISSSSDIISVGDQPRLKQYIISDLERHEDPPIQ
ncbi:MAG: glycine cleavage system protein H [Candidatus Hodarchaeota archaeon]